MSLQPKNLCLRQVGCFTQLILARVNYRKPCALHITLAQPMISNQFESCGPLGRFWRWIVPASPCAKAQLVPRLQLPRAQNAQSLSHKDSQSMYFSKKGNGRYPAKNKCQKSGCHNKQRFEFMFRSLLCTLPSIAPMVHMESWGDGKPLQSIKTCFFNLISRAAHEAKPCKHTHINLLQKAAEWLRSLKYTLRRCRGCRRAVWSHSRPWQHHNRRLGGMKSSRRAVHLKWNSLAKV